MPPFIQRPVGYLQKAPDSGMRSRSRPRFVRFGPVFRPGTEYPILSPGAFTSFFDVYFEISLPSFDNAGLDQPGTFNLGQTFDFIDGVSASLPFVTIPGYSGSTVVVGFDQVSVPEPAAVWFLGAGLAGLLAGRRGRAS